MMSLVRFFALLAATVGVAACQSENQSNNGDASGEAWCADLTGNWLVASWSCNGISVPFGLGGVEFTRTFASSESGLETTRLYVPSGQKETWYERTRGVAVSYTESGPVLTSAAPAERCATHDTVGENWGPISTLGGDQSCVGNEGAPTTVTTRAYDCTVDSGSVVLSFTLSANYGPCDAGETSEEVLTPR